LLNGDRRRITVKIISLLLVVSSLGLGCTGAQLARRPDSFQRGDVIVEGPVVKSIVAGPADIHAYSAFAGGALFVAPRVSGTDGDCHAQPGRPRGATTTLEADRVAVLRIDASQVACLSTVKGGRFELLWHASEHKAAPVALAANLP
jgi:hypothetical protein